MHYEVSIITLGIMKSGIIKLGIIKSGFIKLGKFRNSATNYIGTIKMMIAQLKVI